MKKHIIIRVVVILLLAVMMIPTFATRMENESKNTDVVFSLNYNSAYQALSTEDFDKTLAENRKLGVSAMTIGEESISTLISAGFLTCMNYKDVGTKFDAENEFLTAYLKDDPKIMKESFLIITKRDEAKTFLDKWIPAKYTEDEYTKFDALNNAQVYVIYEGGLDIQKFAIGFNEEKISKANDYGYDISLAMMLGGFSNTDYIKNIAELVDTYNIKYLNLKSNNRYDDESPHAKTNYTAMCELIKEKGLYLVLTENQDQLSNQKPIGYQSLINAADGRVLRSYETVDFKDENLVEARYHQVLNSVVDRNLRMVVINQFISGEDTYKEKSDKTNEATAKIMKKLESVGFNTKSFDTQFDYTVNRKLVSALAVVLLIVMGVTMLELLSFKRLKKLELLGVAGSVLGALATFKLPESLVLLIPTVFAIVAPCFALTVVMAFIKTIKDKLSTVMLTVWSAVLAAVTLALCGFVQTSLLSGLDYYLNSLIFRGIKLSLLVPIVYSFGAYGFMFMENREKWVEKTVGFLNKEIKVYWVVLGVGALGIALIYLIRSGNVTSISSVEALMRNTIADKMIARPRTKEFLIGWPTLVLAVYYIKNSNIKLVKWGFTVASSILFASVINSFCHVFTSADIIFSRLFNGILIGAFVSVAAIVCNALLIRFVKWLVKKYNLNAGR